VALAFVLYWFWDQVGVAMRRSGYPRSPESNDVPSRRYVTRWCAAVALVLAAIAWATDPRAAAWNVIVDCLLIALILAFRFAKELVKPASACSGGDGRASGGCGGGLRPGTGCRPPA